MEPATIEAARALTRAEGVSFIGVMVGTYAQEYAASLAPIATRIVAVGRTDGEQDDLIADLIVDTDR
jgi:hypothetical protein